MQMDKARPFIGCLLQNHLQQDILNFDQHSLMDLMLVSDLNSMGVLMVWFLVFHFPLIFDAVILHLNEFRTT